MAKANKRRFLEGGLDAQEQDSRRTQKSATSMGGSSSTVYNEAIFKGKEMIKFEKDKTYVLKFVPYEVSETHPKVMQGKMKSGQAAYVLDYTQHAVGINKTLVVCPKGTFGKPCPICDRYFDLRQEDPKSEEAKAIKSSRRVLYNVVILKSSDTKISADPDKVRLLQASQWLFESPMLDELRKGDGDEIEEYHIADLCVGSDGLDKALKIMTEEVTSDGMKFIKFSFQVVNNKIELDDDALLDDAVQLHKALNTLSADDLSRMLYGDAEISNEMEEDADKDEDAEDAEDADEDEDEDADEDEDEDDRPAPSKKSSNKSSNKSSKKAPKKASKKVEEEDADEDEPPFDTDDKDAEDEVEKKSVPEGKCPHGHVWGEDYNYEDECEECSVYKECRAAHKALRDAKLNGGK